MQIQVEVPDNNTIRSYSDTQITIGAVDYKKSVIVSKNTIIADWPIQSVQDLNETNIESLLKLEPDVIIIGHQQTGILIPMTVRQFLSTKRIGIECMSIGAASRTFNVLLSEDRNVVLGIVFKT